MNVAFPALLVVLLVLPGIIFRYAYGRGWWGSKSPTSFRTVSDELAYGVVYAAALHAVWLLVVTACGYPVDYAALLALLLGNFGPNNARFDEAVHAVAANPGKIGLYFLSLWLGAGFLGGLFHTVVRRQKWDRTYQFLRFRNEWWYLLSAECLDFSENPFNEAFKDQDRKKTWVYLSAIVDHGKASYLYRGIVTDWTLDKDGQLATVELALAHRRELEKDRSAGEQPVDVALLGAPDARYYDIDGERFILRYSEMRTINLNYASIESEEGNDEGASEQAGVPEDVAGKSGAPIELPAPTLSAYIEGRPVTPQREGSQAANQVTER